MKGGLLFLGLALVMTWMLVSDLRKGYVGGVGKVERSKQPILYWFLVILISVVCLVFWVLGVMAVLGLKLKVS